MGDERVSKIVRIHCCNQDLLLGCFLFVGRGVRGATIRLKLKNAVDNSGKSSSSKFYAIIRCDVELLTDEIERNEDDGNIEIRK